MEKTSKTIGSTSPLPSYKMNYSLWYSCIIAALCDTPENQLKLCAATPYQQIRWMKAFLGQSMSKA